MNQEMRPAGPPEKKGMSKGCLVGLIVGIVLIVLVVGGGLICWYKKDAIMKVGVVTMVNGIRTELQKNPIEGVDTVYVNKIADAFLAKLENDEVSMEKMGALAQSIQMIMQDNAIDADEADDFVRLMVEYYPELGDIAPPDETMMEENMETGDSLGAAEEGQ